MADFFVPGNPVSQNNLGNVTIWFSAKQCAGQPGQMFPSGYLSTSPIGISSSQYTDAFRDTCLAYFDPTSNTPSTPTNQFALDMLTAQFEVDFTNWRSITFDYVFSGILNFVQSGLVDTYEFQYGNNHEVCSTRIYSYPFNYTVHELGHSDVADDCQDLTDTDQPNFDGSPLIYIYGPPVVCNGGVLQLTRYSVALQDGVLVKEFVSTDNVGS